MTTRALLAAAAEHPADYLERLDSAPVEARASAQDLRARLGGPLPERGAPAAEVLEELISGVEGGMLGSAGGRFFGWVIGGGVPAALAADWLTSAWDQNAALYACSPAEAVVEEIVGGG